MSLYPAFVIGSMRLCVHTFKMDISETSKLIAIKFHLRHYCGMGKTCIRFWARLNQNTSLHGNRIAQKGLYGDIAVAMWCTTSVTEGAVAIVN